MEDQQCWETLGNFVDALFVFRIIRRPGITIDGRLQSKDDGVYDWAIELLGCVKLFRSEKKRLVYNLYGLEIEENCPRYTSLYNKLSINSQKLSFIARDHLYMLFAKSQSTYVQYSFFVWIRNARILSMMFHPRRICIQNDCTYPRRLAPATGEQHVRVEFSMCLLAGQQMAFCHSSHRFETPEFSPNLSSVSKRQIAICCSRIRLEKCCRSCAKQRVD